MSQQASTVTAVAYVKLIDFISSNEFYKGEADPGSSTSAAVWRIKHVTIATNGSVTEQWAGGNSNFDKIWNNRLSLSYS